MANKAGGVEKCRICGRGVMVGTRCPKYDGLVHQEHCTACENFVEAFHHCRYREDTLEKARLLEAREKERVRMGRIRAAFMAAVNKKEAPA